MTDGDVESSMNLQVTTEGKFEHNKKKKINAQVEFPLWGPNWHQFKRQNATKGKQWGRKNL